MVAWASSCVDGWAPCFFEQKAESRVCFPFPQAVGGVVASTPRQGGAESLKVHSLKKAGEHNGKHGSLLGNDVKAGRWAETLDGVGKGVWRSMRW